MLTLVCIFDDQYVVLHLKGACIELLAADIADTDVEIGAILRVRYPSNQLGLAVEEDQLHLPLDIVEGNPSHCAAVADILR